MGNLLGAPVTDKETHTGSTSDGSIQFGVSSMQGWRVHMEDAHIMEDRLYAREGSEKIALPGHALFVVMDGHGGTFAAEYSGKNLCRVLSKQPSWVKYAKFANERAEKEKDMSPTDKAAYVRSGLDYLENSLREALVDLDREIGTAVNGTAVEDADTPYHSEPDEKTAESEKDAATSNYGNDMDTSDDKDGGKTATGVAGNIIHSVAEAAHNAVVGELGDSGTTVCMVLITPDWIICANAGDSRAVLSRASRVLPLSYDHKPDDDSEERRIRAAGGYVAGGRVNGDLAVSRGLGDFRFKNLETVLAGNNRDEDSTLLPPDDQKVSPIPDIIVQNRNSEQDEFIIVACDGIWDVQSNYNAVKAIADMFSEGESDLGLICEEMLDTCLSIGSKDNMTTLVVKLSAQRIGSGEGITARREKRSSENKPKSAESASS